MACLEKRVLADGSVALLRQSRLIIGILLDSEDTTARLSGIIPIRNYTPNGQQWC